MGRRLDHDATEQLLITITHALSILRSHEIVGDAMGGGSASNSLFIWPYGSQSIYGGVPRCVLAHHQILSDSWLQSFTTLCKQLPVF
jgi:hypothetical protein